jgi:hypothetical protein
MNDQKKDFLKNDFIPLLQKLKGDEKGLWGVLNAQQMVEHFADSVKNASGKLVLPPVYDGETLDKNKEFLMTEHPFKEGTKNPLMTEEAAPMRQPDMASAIDKLKSELNDFFKAYDSNSELKNNNPFFVELDYAGQVQLLHKHAMHHLKQFGLV